MGSEIKQTRYTTNTEDMILLIMLDFAVFNAKKNMTIDEALKNSVKMYEFLKDHINNQ